jgi:hypothetical protein
MRRSLSMSVRMKDRGILILVIGSSCVVLILLWFASLHFTSLREEAFRASIANDLVDAIATYESLRVQIVAANKEHESYQATIKRDSEEQWNAAYAGWINSRERECDLEVLLRKRLAAIEGKVRDRSERIVLPEWLREDKDWQTLQKHVATSEFLEPIDGCKAHYGKLR